MIKTMQNLMLTILFSD